MVKKKNERAARSEDIGSGSSLCFRFCWDVLTRRASQCETSVFCKVLHLTSSCSSDTLQHPPPLSPLCLFSHSERLRAPHISLCFLFSSVFQKMFLYLLPVVVLLLSGETVVSGNSNDKWLSTVPQYNKDRSWNRFRDVSYTEGHNIYLRGAL